MIDFITAIQEYQFLQYALLAGILSSVGCGIMGSYVVVKRIGFLAGGIAHSVLSGMGIAYFFSYAPLYGAIIAAIIAALAIGWLSIHTQEQEDTLIAAFWSMGMAIGILFISKTPHYNVDLMSYLFGNILMVSQQEIYFMLLLDSIIIILVSMFYRQLQAVTFDEEYTRLQNISVSTFYLLLLCMISLTVVLLIQIVGLILVIALLTLPAAIAAHHTHALKTMMLSAILLSCFFTNAGVAIAYNMDIPAGASIILLTASCYFLSFFVSQKYRQWHINKNLH